MEKIETHVVKKKITKRFKIRVKDVVGLNTDLFNYFTFVSERQEIAKGKLDDILSQYKDSKPVVFLLWWMAFSYEAEGLIERIYDQTEVYYFKDKITDTENLKMTTKQLNTYAFDISVDLQLYTEALAFVVRQGKMEISMEWLLDRLRMQGLAILEEAWFAGIDTYFSTQELLSEYSAFLKADIQKKKTKTKTASIFDKKAAPKQTFKSFNKALSDAKTIKIRKNIAEAKEREQRQLTVGKRDRLNFVKLIILCNLIRVPKSPFGNPKQLKNKSRELIIAVCSFDREKKYSTEIVEALFLTNDEKIAIRLLESGILKVSLSVFQNALFFKRYRFCLLFYSIYRNLDIFNEEGFFLQLIESMKANVDKIEFYLYFVKKFCNGFSLKVTKNYIKVATLLLKYTKTGFNLFNVVSNPIKIYVLLAETLKILETKYSSLEYSIQKLIKKALDFAEGIQNSIDEDNLLRELILDVDYEKRTCLETISSCNFLQLLKNKFIEKILEDMWSGPFDCNGSVFETSSNYKALCASMTETNYDYFTETRRLKYKEKAYLANFTNYSIWRKNVFIKFLFEFLFWIVLVIFFQACTITIQIKYKNVFEILETNSKSIDKIKEEIFENISTINEVNLYLSYVMRLFLFLPVGYLLRSIYWVKNRQPTFGSALLIDFLIFAIAASNIFYSYKNEDTQVLLDRLEEGKEEEIVEELRLSDPLYFILVKYGFIAFFLWIKIITLLKTTKSFGPLVVIFYLSVKGILTYILLFFIINVTFCTVFIFSLYQVKTFWAYDIPYFFFYTFTISMGNEIYYEDYTTEYIKEHSPYLPYLAGGIIVTFSLINLVIFLNLIIALLTNIYEKYYINSIQLYIQERLDFRNKYFSEDERFDGIIAAPYPIDILILPFTLPFLLFNNRSALILLNRFLLRINYTIYMLIFVLSYTVCTALMAPVAYLKICLTKVIQLFIRDYQDYFFIFKLFSMIIYFVLGLPLQIAFFLVDLVIFIRQMFRENLVFRFETEENDRFYVKYSFLVLIQDFLSELELEEEKLTIIEFLYVLQQYAREVPSEFNQMIKQMSSTGKSKEQKLNVNSATKEIKQSFFELGYNYEQLEEFLMNFADKSDLIRLQSLRDIVDCKLAGEELMIFYSQVTDKSFDICSDYKRRKLFSEIKQCYRKQEAKVETFYEKLISVRNLNLTLTEIIEKRRKKDQEKLKALEEAEPKEEKGILGFFKRKGNEESASRRSYRKKLSKNQSLLSKALRSNRSYKNTNIFEFKTNFKNVNLGVVGYRESVNKLGKIVVPFVTFQMVPRDLICSFIEEQEEYKQDVNNSIKENAIRNTLELDKIRKDQEREMNKLLEGKVGEEIKSNSDTTIAYLKEIEKNNRILEEFILGLLSEKEKRPKKGKLLEDVNRRLGSASPQKGPSMMKLIENEINKESEESEKNSQGEEFELEENSEEDLRMEFNTIYLNNQ